MEGYDQEKQLKVTFPETDLKVFELLVKWLFVGESNLEVSNVFPPHQHVQAWILGQKLECPAFQDTAMLHLLYCHYEPTQTLFQQRLDPQSMELACTVTPQTSKLRLWAIDEFLYDCSSERLQTTADKGASVLCGPYDIERNVTDI